MNREQDDRKRLYSPSATGQLFHASAAEVRAVMGPYGSGKSVMCCTELLLLAIAQEPDNQGVRSTRWLVVRNSYGQLLSTTIETFMHWNGHLGRLTLGAPIRFLAEQPMPDGTMLRFEVFFLALDRPEDNKKLLSLEVTGAWLNEAGELSARVLEDVKGRIGRFPPMSDGAGATRVPILIDTNPPSTRSWFYRLFEVDRPLGHVLFKQPGALLRTEKPGEFMPNPLAENISNIKEGYEYYLRQTRGATDDFINVKVLGQYGSVFDGQPVYGAWRDREHVSPSDLEFNRGRPLIIGMDFGLMPAAVFTQVSPLGAVHVLDELAPVEVTLEEFLDEYFLPKIAARFRGANLLVIGDPTGVNRNALAKADAMRVLRERGIAAIPASTNDIVMRIDSVSHYLQRRHAFALDRRCTMLREGFNGGYKFEKNSLDHIRAKPAKDEFSHPHDALQYACLYWYRGMTSDKRKEERRRKASGKTPGVYHYA